jgi:hypothetical protein
MVLTLGIKHLALRSARTPLRLLVTVPLSAPHAPSPMRRQTFGHKWCSALTGQGPQTTSPKCGPQIGRCVGYVFEFRRWNSIV